ncbi:MAG: Biotin transporter BioY [Firmicutes bacterium ADurb.Bin193]|nr:MAG: Biotin transporter BioY [Firmicutes bacterium ADurb.Bin193]
MKFTTKDLLLVSVFTAVMVIFAQISIPLPFSPVPITLSIFAVFMSSMLLGMVRGTIVQIVYVLLGACGAPVFQGFVGGPAKLFGPTGGYIISYIFMALVMGALVESFKLKGRFAMGGVMLIGLAVCYGFGTAWLCKLTGMNLSKALTLAVIPFVPLDLVKIAVTAVVAYDLKARLLKANLLPQE